MTDPATAARPFQIRLHGRGGQGVVTAAELLSVAAFLDGREAQAFPSFGSERTGAPVVSFCRIADRQIRSREPIAEPDVVILIDATLLRHGEVFSGLHSDGYVVINSGHGCAELGVPELLPQVRPDRVVTVPATELAREHTGRPQPNVAVLGTFAALTRAVSLASIEKAVHHRFSPAVAEANIRAAWAAYQAVPEGSRA